MSRKKIPIDTIQYNIKYNKNSNYNKKYHLINDGCCVYIV